MWFKRGLGWIYFNSTIVGYETEIGIWSCVVDRRPRDYRVLVLFLYSVLVDNNCTLLLLGFRQQTMEPNNTDSTTGNPRLFVDHVNEDQNTASVNVQDQTLLMALQDLIVRVMDPVQKNNINSIHSVPEAGKLIVALREFISSIVVRSPSAAEIPLIVRLDEENVLHGSDLEDELDEGDLDDDLHENSDSDATEEDNESSLTGVPLSKISSSESELYGVMEGLPEVAKTELKILWKIQRLEKEISRLKSEEEMRRALQGGFFTPIPWGNSGPISKETLLRALREHVFNMMPIRLLSFEPHGESSFQIVLLERGDIYKRLASTLQANMHEEEFLPQSMPYSDFPYTTIMETDQEVSKRLISKYARYAILSHTWLRTASGEVTYGKWKQGLFDARDLGYQKILNFCKAAWRDHGLVFGWMDTVCINKESSSELDESIRSMYNWYKRAALCITYLGETSTIANMHVDAWFTRGWTLQELLAPHTIKFYNGNWKPLVEHSTNDKKDARVTIQIERATSISKAELDDVHWIPISRKMQLAAMREVTREEDTAYSLMGIFNVSFSTAYGEGAPRAFFRLLQEILASTNNVLDIFNWAGRLHFIHPYSSRILPTSPKFYINRSSSKSLMLSRPIEPLILTHLGLRVPVILMPGKRYTAPQPDPIGDYHTMPGIFIPDAVSRHNPIGDYYAAADLSTVADVDSEYRTTSKYNLLEKGIFDGYSRKPKDGSSWHYEVPMTFGVFNFSTGPTSLIQLPKTCIAIGLYGNQGSGEVSITRGATKLDTSEPIVFELRKTTADEKKSNDQWFYVKLDELAKHGMRQISLYL